MGTATKYFILGDSYPYLDVSMCTYTYTFTSALSANYIELDFSGAGDACQDNVITVTAGDPLQKWNVSKVDNGYGTLWLTIDKTEGYGNSNITVYVYSQSGGGTQRSAYVHLTSSDCDPVNILIKQLAYGNGCS